MKYIKLIIKNNLQAISTSYWYLTKEMTCNILSYKIDFTLTINRAQVQSASKCGILLPKSIWTHGRIYVAFQDVVIQTIFMYGQNNNNFMI